MHMGSFKHDRGSAVWAGLSGALIQLAALAFMLFASSLPAASQNSSYDQYAEDEEAPAPTLAIEPAQILPMPRVTIYPNDTITEEMLANRDYFGEGKGHAVFKTHEGLVGKVSKQTLLPNAPIPVNAVRDPFAIKLGQPAMVIFQSGTLMITGTAVPLQPGSVGEMIALRNTDSNTTIRGIVQPDGTVRVGP
jgi:flagella basal body P-ring formation protein FlgA